MHDFQSIACVLKMYHFSNGEITSGCACIKKCYDPTHSEQAQAEAAMIVSVWKVQGSWHRNRMSYFEVVASIFHRYDKVALLLADQFACDIELRANHSVFDLGPQRF